MIPYQSKNIFESTPNRKLRLKYHFNGYKQSLPAGCAGYTNIDAPNFYFIFSCLLLSPSTVLQIANCLIEKRVIEKFHFGRPKRLQVYFQHIYCIGNTRVRKKIFLNKIDINLLPYSRA
jgi:hypothetical protein